MIGAVAKPQKTATRVSISSGTWFVLPFFILFFGFGIFSLAFTFFISVFLWDIKPVVLAFFKSICDHLELCNGKFVVHPHRIGFLTTP